jgi:hypothetical protein
MITFNFYNAVTKADWGFIFNSVYWNKFIYLQVWMFLHSLVFSPKTALGGLNLLYLITCQKTCWVPGGFSRYGVSCIPPWIFKPTWNHPWKSYSAGILWPGVGMAETFCLQWDLEIVWGQACNFRVRQECCSTLPRYCRCFGPNSVE